MSTEAKQGKHTPTPWITKRMDQFKCICILTPELDAEHRQIATIMDLGPGIKEELDEGDEANAELICRAVNSHSALVEALEALERYWDGKLLPGMPGAKTASELVDQAKAAIRLAKGESQ